MTNEWIIDVLLDLKKFSAANDMQMLAEHLDDTILVATTELSNQVIPARRMAGDIEQVRGFTGSASQGDFS